MKTLLNRLIPCGLAAIVSPGLALAQQTMTFSIDHASSTMLDPACGGGAPIRSSDVLAPATASGSAEPFNTATPCIAIPASGGVGSLSLLANSAFEIDALSYGSDAPISPVIRPGAIWFSVDRASRGVAQPSASQPSVRGEWSMGEAAGSVFCDYGIPGLPFVAPFPIGKQLEIVDGNGLANASGRSSPGLGLVEPVGDNVDAFDVGPSGGLVYFSIDSNFVDACAGLSGSGTGQAMGLAPAAILRSNLSGVAPQVWVTAAQLGLDVMGIGTDDIDALAIANQGPSAYNPIDSPFGWVNGGGDMVLFSVRRGSAVIGNPDSLYGQPIQPGDVLMQRLPGGVSAFPAIAIPAEALGLTTSRAGNGFACGVGTSYDDLDALDTLADPVWDCDVDGGEDRLQIAGNNLPDLNLNGLVDDCDSYPPAKIYCTAGTTTHGCTASIGSAGTASASGATTLLLTASQMEGQKTALFFYGINGATNVPWGLSSTSFLCVKVPVQRTTAISSGGTSGACNGAITLDFTAYVAAHPGALGAPFAAGDDVWTQAWFRDPPTPKTTNLSNALRFTFIP